MFKDMQGQCDRSQAGGAMRVMVGEVGMSQTRQALLYCKESEVCSRYNRSSWRYKARMADICYNFGYPAPNSPSYLEFPNL